MALGPNQTGSILTPVSGSLGYGFSLNEQMKDEEDQRRKKLLSQQSVTPAAALSRMLGYSVT
jgi:hypothetical protein